MTWALYILMALLSAGVVAYVARGIHRRQQGRQQGIYTRIWPGFAVLVPVAALLLYQGLGRPDLPAQPMRADRAAGADDRNAALLALHPMEVLFSDNPEDIGALKAMGEINMRLGKYGAAVPYLEEALARARAMQDRRMPGIAKALEEATAAAAQEDR